MTTWNFDAPDRTMTIEDGRLKFVDAHGYEYTYERIDPADKPYPFRKDWAEAFTGLWEITEATGDEEYGVEPMPASVVDAWRADGLYLIYVELADDGTLKLDEWGDTLTEGEWMPLGPNKAIYGCHYSNDEEEWDNYGLIELKDGKLVFHMTEQWTFVMQPMPEDNRSELTPTSDDDGSSV